MLAVANLRKSYGPLTAVDGLSLEVHPGETFGLLGPNGAGKSTTISMIVGLLRPDGGQVRVNGGDPLTPEVRRVLGLAPQALSLYEELTADENLRFFGRLYGLHGGQLLARVDWALEFAGLTDRRRSRVSQYSGGMKRRLNLAAALLHAPKLLLLDEPTVGVDPQSRNHIFERVADLKRSGVTVLYTTHYMEEAERLCDRVAIMDAGRILALDSPAGLIARFAGERRIVLQIEGPPPQGLELPGRLTGCELELTSARPLDDLQHWTRQGLKFTELHVHSPGLETVFLTLTGRSLRDD